MAFDAGGQVPERETVSITLTRQQWHIALQMLQDVPYPFKHSAPIIIGISNQLAIGMAAEVARDGDQMSVTAPEGVVP